MVMVDRDVDHSSNAIKPAFHISNMASGVVGNSGSMVGLFMGSGLSLGTRNSVDCLPVLAD